MAPRQTGRMMSGRIHPDPVRRADESRWPLTYNGYDSWMRDRARTDMDVARYYSQSRAARGWDIAVLTYNRQEYDQLLDHGFGQLPHQAKQIGDNQYQRGLDARRVESWSNIAHAQDIVGRRFDWVVTTRAFWQRPDAQRVYDEVASRLPSRTRPPRDGHDTPTKYERLEAFGELFLEGKRAR